MNAKELKAALIDIAEEIPTEASQKITDSSKIEDILAVIKSSIIQVNDNSKKKIDDLNINLTSIQNDLNFYSKRLDEKNKEIVELNKVITEQESPEVGNPNSDNDNEELLLAYGVNQNTSELDKINNGFEILTRRAGKERVRIFTQAAMGNLTQFAYDEEATLNYLKEKLPEALLKVGFEKVEGKLKIAQKEANKKD